MSDEAGEVLSVCHRQEAEAGRATSQPRPAAAPNPALWLQGSHAALPRARGVVTRGDLSASCFWCSEEEGHPGGRSAARGEAGVTRARETKPALLLRNEVPAGFFPLGQAAAGPGMPAGKAAHQQASPAPGQGRLPARPPTGFPRQRAGPAPRPHRQRPGPAGLGPGCLTGGGATQGALAAELSPPEGPHQDKDIGRWFSMRKYWNSLLALPRVTERAGLGSTWQVMFDCKATSHVPWKP